MRKLVTAALIIILIFLAVVLTIKPLIVSIAVKQLKKTLQVDDVTIEDCKLNLFREIRFIGLALKKAKSLDLVVDELQVNFTLASLIKKSIPNISVKGMSLTLDLTNEALLPNFSSKRGRDDEGFNLKELTLVDAALDIRLKGLVLVASGLATVDVNKSELKSINAKIASLESGSVKLKDALVMVEHRQLGALSVKNVQANKLKVENITAQLKLDNKNLVIESIKARMLNGIIEGDARIVLDMMPEYEAQLIFSELGVKRFIKDFELDEKVDMTGSFSGRLNLKGKGMEIKGMNGAFEMAPAGGLLIIKDMRFLENMARQTDQPVDIVVDSFKSYQYNNGSINLSVEENSLVADMALGGDAGKRNLNIVVHDFVNQ